MKILKNKNAIITGANQGLGLEIAKEFIRAGANVMLCARDGELLEKVRLELIPSLRLGQKLLTLATDVSNEKEVQSLIDLSIDQMGSINVLVNNAGIYGPKGTAEDVDWLEWVRAIEINLFGSIIMCRAVLPFFKAQGYGKIVQISGGGATNPLPRMSAYAVSKAAIVRFIETLAEEVRENNIDVNAIAPGALNTRLLNEILEAGPDKVGEVFFQRSLKQKQNGGSPLGMGAALAVYLASKQSDGITGKLISAVWDPWKSLGEHLEDLNSSDIYTLRRIVPKDRGKTWGNDQ